MRRPRARLHRVRCCDGRTATWREKWVLRTCPECNRKLPGEWVQNALAPLRPHAGPITTKGYTQTCGHCGKSWPSLAGILAKTYDKATVAAAAALDSVLLQGIRGPR